MSSTRSSAQLTSDRVEPVETVPSDPRMVAALWPVLVASAVGLVPFTVFSTFLVPIAQDAGTSVATAGSMRGLGGLAALVVGTALAPLIDRVSKEWTIAGALVLLAASSLLGVWSHVVALITFCLLIGAATAVLNPALSTTAADRYGSGAAAARAATLVSATTSLTAVLAGPLVALPALVWGWRGDLVATAVLAMLLATLFVARRHRSTAEVTETPAQRLTYLGAFRALAAVPGAVPLVLVGFLRTAAFMGYLAYLAAFYDARFALGPSTFAFVWTLSGASFFVGNLLVGRFLNTASERAPVERVLVAGVVAALVAVVGFYLAPTLPVALAFTSLLGLSHATVAACVVSLLVRRCGSLRGSALSVNAAGQSFGVLVGAGVGGVGLGVAGYLGTAAVFGGLTAVALAAAFLVLRSARANGDR